MRLRAIGGGNFRLPPLFHSIPQEITVRVYTLADHPF
jgi:hypothetical protein